MNQGNSTNIGSNIGNEEDLNVLKQSVNDLRAILECKDQVKSLFTR